MIPFARDAHVSFALKNFPDQKRLRNCGIEGKWFEVVDNCLKDGGKYVTVDRKLSRSKALKF